MTSGSGVGPEVGRMGDLRSARRRRVLKTGKIIFGYPLQFESFSTG